MPLNFTNFSTAPMANYGRGLAEGDGFKYIRPNTPFNPQNPGADWLNFLGNGLAASNEERMSVDGANTSATDNQPFYDPVSNTMVLQLAGENGFRVIPNATGGGTTTKRINLNGLPDYQYDASGKFLRQGKVDYFEKPGDGGLASVAGILALPFAAGALGIGAGAGAAGAGGAAGGAAGAGAAGGAAGAGALDLGGGLFMTADGAIVGGAGAFAPATAAEMAGMGLGSGTAAMGAGAAGAGMTDLGGGLSIGADGAITGATGAFTPATAAEMASMGVGGGGFLSGLGSAASSLFGGGGAGGAAGGFNWGSLIGPAISTLGGLYGASQARSAADAQLQATREAQAKLEPWYQAGGNSLTRLQELLGIGGNKGAADYGSAGRDFGMADFKTDPGYGFRQSEGEKGLQRAASAAGGVGSGKFLKDAMSFNQGLASQEYGNAFNRFQTARTNKLNPLQSLAGLGQSAAGTVADLSTQGGNAIAAGKVGSANALTGAIGQGYSMYQNSQQMDNNNSLMNLLLRR